MFPEGNGHTKNKPASQLGLSGEPGAVTSCRMLEAVEYQVEPELGLVCVLVALKCVLGSQLSEVVVFVLRNLLDRGLRPTACCAYRVAACAVRSQGPGAQDRNLTPWSLPGG